MTRNIKLTLTATAEHHFGSCQTNASPSLCSMNVVGLACPPQVDQPLS